MQGMVGDWSKLLLFLLWGAHTRKLKHAINNKLKQVNKYFVMWTLFATFKIY